MVFDELGEMGYYKAPPPFPLSAIIGITVAGVVLVAFIIGIICLLRKNTKYKLDK